jgi:hypothetical protein
LDGIVCPAAFHSVLDHDELFLNPALVPGGGWLEAQCGGGPNRAQLRKRWDAADATPRYSRSFADFREPWFFPDAEQAAVGLRRVGLMEVETSLEAAPTILKSVAEYNDFVRNIILRRHLDQLPTEDLHKDSVRTPAQQTAADEAPFLLEYGRLCAAEFHSPGRWPASSV